MNYTSVVLSVADINAARKFYEDLFGLELDQDYGIQHFLHLRPIPAAEL